MCMDQVHERNLLREVMSFNFCMRGNKIGSECSKKISDIILLFFSLTNCGLNGHDFVWPAPKYFLREAVAGGQSQIKRRNFMQIPSYARAAVISVHFLHVRNLRAAPLFSWISTEKVFFLFLVRACGNRRCVSMVFTTVAGFLVFGGGSRSRRIRKRVGGKKQLGSGLACPKCRNSATIYEFNES